MKDHDKYIYVEIALPKDNPAVQNLLARFDRTTTPLRVLVKEAVILAYTDEEEDGVPRVKPVKKSGKKRTGKGAVVTDAAKESANSLLDDMGF